MGGAVAAAAARHATLAPVVKGLCMVDIVEGTAMASLKFMNSYLAARPARFCSLEDGVRYSVSAGGMVSNLQSARLSVPPQLVAVEGGGFGWRTDLASTEPHWHGWFDGLNASFLTARCPKMLVLAGHDRLDKDMTFAHMAGKFQLELLPACGHCVQEENPPQVARYLAAFARRHMAVIPVLKRF